MNHRTDRLSDEALECFVHGVAHLIDEHGYATGLRTAGEFLAHLREAGSEDISVGASSDTHRRGRRAQV